MGAWSSLPGREPVLTCDGRPNFETLQNYENWDVVGLEFEEEVSHECT